MIRQNGQRECTEGVVGFSVFVDLLRVIVKYDAGPVRSGASDRYGGDPKVQFFPENAFGQFERIAGTQCV